jgi:chemotaxis signal transduction protein
VARGGQPHGRIVLFSTADPRPRERPLAFGLNITQVDEVLGLPALTPVPHTAPFLVGLANWRDQPVPVLDLARRLGLPPSAPDARSRLLVVSAGAPAAEPHDRAGFLVRPSVRVLRLPLAHRPCIRMPPLEPALVRGAVELPQETLVIPHLQRVLAAPP